MSTPATQLLTQLRARLHEATSAEPFEIHYADGHYESVSFEAEAVNLVEGALARLDHPVREFEAAWDRYQEKRETLLIETTRATIARACEAAGEVQDDRIPMSPAPDLAPVATVQAAQEAPDNG